MADLTDILIGTSAEVFLAVVMAGAIYRIWGSALGLPQRTKVSPLHRGVLMKGESIDRVLGPGSYWLSPKRTLILCDTRPKPFQANGLEVLTADMRWVRISLKGETVVSIPETYAIVSGEPRATFYGDLRQAVHAVTAKQRSDLLINDKSAFTASLASTLAEYAKPLGLTVSKLEVWEAIGFGWHHIETVPESNMPLIH